MNNAKHTQGPWAADHAFGVGPISDSDDQSYGMVLAVADIYGDNRVVDSRLIAAAPELLEAVEKLLLWVELMVGYLGVEPEDVDLVFSNSKTGQSEDVSLKEHLEQAIAAVAKATGVAPSAAQAAQGTKL